MEEWVEKRRTPSPEEHPEVARRARHDMTSRDQLIALQRSAGNQAGGRLLQRAKVESWELAMRESVVHMRHSPQQEFVPVNDSTNGEYLDRAEAALGDREPLNILAKWDVLPRAKIPAPWWRSHLIGAEFGGQKKYSPADNVRYHPVALEQGEWQAAETAVKKQQQGTLHATSDECRGAAALAKQVADALKTEVGPELVPALQQTLKAADNVAESVSFKFVTPEGQAAVNGSWGNQNAMLKVIDGVDPKKVFSALAEMQAAGKLPKEAITIAPENLVPATAEITTFEGLRDYLARAFANSGNPRKIAIKKKLKELVANLRVNDAAFTQQVANMPEVKGLPDKPKLSDVRSWLTVDNVDDVL
jgi:hypothetical protein